MYCIIPFPVYALGCKNGPVDVFFFPPIMSALTEIYDLMPAQSYLRPCWKSSNIVIRKLLCKSRGVWK